MLKRFRCTMCSLYHVALVRSIRCVCRLRGSTFIEQFVRNSCPIYCHFGYKMTRLLTFDLWRLDGVSQKSTDEHLEIMSGIGIHNQSFF